MKIEDLKKLFLEGQISRRDFIRASAIVGLSASAAGSILNSVALAQEPQMGGHFIMAGNGSSTDSFDPVTYDNFGNSQLGRSTMNRLVYQDETGNLVPRLATSWDSNDDFTVWTVQLREGVEFHNGKTMTADDVVYSLQRHTGEGSVSGAAGNLTTVTEYKATGDNELQITLSEGNIDFIFLLTDYHLMIQPEGSTDDGIGTGAFVLEDFDPGVRVTFSKNANYWDAPRPYYDSYELVTINDITSRTAALQTGQVHAIDRIDLKGVDFLRQAPNVVINDTPSRGHYNFIAMTDTNPYDLPDLILAMKYALPRQQIIDSTLGGFGALGNDHPISSGYALFEDGVEQRPYDLEQAKFHYDKSGHSGTITLRSSEASWPNATDAALIFKESAAQIGMNIDVKREPADGFWNNVWNVMPFCASYWIARATQDQIFTVAYTGDWNDTRFQNEEFTTLLQQARVEPDESTRAGMYTRMQQLVHDNSGALIPVYNSFVDAISSEVQGYVGSPSNTLMDQLIQEKTWFGS